MKTLINRARRVVIRWAMSWLLPEAEELALAVENADFSAPGCEDVLKPMAFALLLALGVEG